MMLDRTKLELQMDMDQMSLKVVELERQLEVMSANYRLLKAEIDEEFNLRIKTVIECADLERKLEEAKKDTERLEWLRKHFDAETFFQSDRLQEELQELVDNGFSNEAIDNAMRTSNDLH